jgi:hypothetical protein
LKIPAKRCNLRAWTSYFSDNNDLMAEKGGFKLSIQLYSANPRVIRKLHMARALRENLTSEFQTKRFEKSYFYSFSIRLQR